MLLQKRTDTRGIGISNMRKSITSLQPHPLATPIHSTHSQQLSSILLTCAKFKVWMTIVEWVECIGVASGCGEQEVGVASGSGWNLWVWLVGVVVKRYIDFLILLITTRLVSVLFCSSIPTFCSFKKCFSFLFQYFLGIKFYLLNNFFTQYKHTRATTAAI